MPRSRLASVALLLLCVAACARSSSRGHGVIGITTIAGMLSDPARNQVYVADASSGRMVALSAATGDPVRELSLGNTIGGMALDHCYRQIYVAVTGGLRIDVIDADTFKRTASLRMGTTVFALGNGVEGHLLAVTGRGLLDLDVAHLTMTTLEATVDKDALVASDRALTRAWLAESVGDETVVSAFDLANLATPPVVTPAGTLLGRPVAVSSSFDGSRFYVATDGDDGVAVFDGATLAKLGSIDAGPGLVAMTTNTAGTRMHFSKGDALVSSVNLDTYTPGRDVLPAAGPSERGLQLAPDNLGLVVHATDASTATYPTFDLRMTAPTAVRQGNTYTLTMDGTPNAPWYLFVSLAPGYLYIDPPTSVDPRFFDLSIPDGFAVLAFGRFDPAGHTELTGAVPDDFTTSVDFVIQSAELPHRGRAYIEVSNPMVVRFLGDDCN